MIIDFLISSAGVRAAKVDLSISGVTLTKGVHGLVPQHADAVEGSVRLTLADLTAALRRPEILDLFLKDVAGLAKPELTLADGVNGGIRIVGSVELLGQRMPITAASSVHIRDNQLVVSATQVEGLPIIGALPIQLLDLVLPMSLPPGFDLTGVTVEPGAIILGFAGKDVSLRPPE